MARRTLLLLLASLLSIAGISPVAASHDFTDVPDEHVFHGNISWLAAEGITKGCNPPTNDQYCPNDNVTRGQMAAFLTRALNLTDPGPGGYFTDTPGNTFEADINKIYTAGITKGCNPPTNDQYCPNDNVTRGQMAAFLQRALDEPPAMVTGLIVTLSGGSGEIDVSWEPNAEADIDHYNVWYSEQPGDPKTLLSDPYGGPDVRENGRIYIVDWPRSVSTGIDCYQISAVDIGGQEGTRSVEECFDSWPGAPDPVTGVTVGTGGGSAEAYVSWPPISTPDLKHYNVYYSEFPGGPYTLVQTVDEDVRDGSNRVFFIHFPVDLMVGKTCYLISGVDLGDKEGPTSTEACFMP